jgi:hypothetical protein
MATVESNMKEKRGQIIRQIRREIAVPERKRALLAMTYRD